MANASLSGLWDLGYSASDIIGTLFKVTKVHDKLQEGTKLQFLREIGFVLDLNLYTDSNAGKGMATRKGVGKVRHLDVQDLWVQRRIRNGDFSLHKIDGEKKSGGPLHQGFADGMQNQGSPGITWMSFRGWKARVCTSFEADRQREKSLPDD